LLGLGELRQLLEFHDLAAKLNLAWTAKAGCPIYNYSARRHRNNPMQPLIEYEQSSGLVREVYDDIRATRKTDDINNFWKAIANHPPTLQRTWAMLKEVMAGPGELDPLTRELIYVAVSVTNGCDYCIASHRAAAVSKGMTETMYGELMSVVPTANMTNRLANGFQVPLDEKFKQPV
jgi:AhpD family alkylhydroperoxidase